MIKKSKKGRTLAGLFFLFLIFVLWLTDRMQVWMVIMLLAFVTTPVWGRLYCGWVCPVSTALDFAGPSVKTKKYGVNSKWLKYLIFIIFLIVFAIMNKTGFPVPFFIMLIPIAFIISLLCGEAFWHNICPFGTVFGLLARFSKYGYYFVSLDCSRCGLCENICKAGCLVVGDEPDIRRQECLNCARCLEICPQQNIKYGIIR